MSSLKPFSPPFTVDATQKRYGCYIEMDGQPHEAHWTGEWAVFDFSDTSDLSDFSIHPVQFSAEIREVWSKTEPLAFGSHACIRKDDTQEYPVVKIAHPSEFCRQLISREYHLMQDLSATGAVAKVAINPLTDEGGIFGFRIERLHHVDIKEVRQRFGEIEGLLESLHAAGFCHGDWSPSNVLKTQEGALLLIDLAFAGRLNDPVPDTFPRYIFPNKVFAKAADKQRLRRWRIQYDNDGRKFNKRNADTLSLRYQLRLISCLTPSCAM